MRTIYLAIPYSHPDPAVRQQRFEVANRVAGHLMVEQKCNVFSPISHSHPIAETLDGVSPNDRDFWLTRSLEFLKHCDELCIVQIDGWETSVGVTTEHLEALKFQIPVSYCEVGLNTIVYKPVDAF